MNVKAHLEVVQLHQKVDRLEAMLEQMTGDDIKATKAGIVQPT